MKKVLPLLVLVGACTPDIAQEGQPPKAVSVVFDLNHKVVPLPNDLAKDPTTGKIVVPDSPTDTAAQKEFNHDYLGQLDGFPFESTASVSFDGDLKPETVTPASVLVIDITNPAAPTPVDGAAPAYVPPTKSVVIPPPGGAWTRGHHYAVALVGGPSGLRGANGEDVIGSASWALVSGKTPIIACTDPKNLDTCTLNVDIIPSTKTDPAEKLRDEKTTALQLEQIRVGYNQILGALELKGIPRANVPQIWTFGIIDSGEVTFDPANSVIPFPNDVLRDPSTGKVKMPNPKTGKPLTDADCQTTDATILLYCGLNTLDGFSTAAPLVSETSDKLGAVAQANLAGGTLSTANVGLAPLRSQAPKEIQTKPQYTPCLNCLSSKDLNGNPQTSPQQLQWKLDVPLDEKTTYAAWVTTDPKDDKGRNVIPAPVFALVRSAAPLVENGKAAVNILTDDQAAQLEVLRVGYKPMFDALETQQIHRANLALAFPFTTQSESTTLDQLQAYPSTPALTLPDTPLGAIVDVSAQIFPLMDLKSLPRTHIAKIYASYIVTPVAVTGPGGTLNPQNPLVQAIPFFISIPNTTPPGSGYPVTLFGHGLTRYRGDFLAFADSAAAVGNALISIDLIFHGDRSSCTGAHVAVTGQTSDDVVCADPATMKCDGGKPFGLCVNRAGTRDACQPGPGLTGDLGCIAKGQGRCAADSQCQGAGAGFLPESAGSTLPKISGWNHLNPANFFQTRDNVRQSVIDFAQLVRVVKSTASSANGVNLVAQVQGGAGALLDRNHINYIGQSLGGIEGALFNAVSPDTRNVVLNVTGGNWVTLLATSIQFKPLADPLFAALAAQGINSGTPQFDQFFATVQWILDPADPVNVAYRLTHPVDLGNSVQSPPTDRKLFEQFIEGDQAVTNPASFLFLEAANRSFQPVPPRFNCQPPLFCFEFTEKGTPTFDATTATPDTRHGFLLAPPSGSAGLSLFLAAQQQAATFLATGALP